MRELEKEELEKLEKQKREKKEKKIIILQKEFSRIVKEIKEIEPNNDKSIKAYLDLQNEKNNQNKKKQETIQC